jgi:hypothetical protein
MFLLDDILFAPMKGLMAIGRHIQNTAQEQLEDQEKAIIAELTEIYRMLESGQISDEEFNTREADLLDRLEKTEEAQGSKTAEEEPGPTRPGSEKE